MKKIILASAFVFSLFTVSCDSDDRVYSGGEFIQFTETTTESVNADENVPTVSIPLSLSKVSSNDVTVTFNYYDGTAINGTHYVSTASAVIPAGQLTGEVVVGIIDDSELNLSRTFDIEIASISDNSFRVGLGQLTSYRKTVVIINDECTSTASFFTGDLNVYEDGYGSWEASATGTGRCNQIKYNDDIIAVGSNYDHIITFTPDPTSDGSYGTVSSPVVLTTTSPGTVNVNNSPVRVYYGISLTGTYDSNSNELILNYRYSLYSLEMAEFVISGYNGTGTLEVSKP